jgi:tetratricopeptide (TPR) repeat protein
MNKVGTVSKDAEYYYHLAVDNQHKERPEKVLEYFDHAIAAHPSYAMAWNEKANFLDFIGRCEEAVQCYDMAIRLDPDSAEAWFNKGLTLKKMGREHEAASCINRGIEFACGR